MKIPDIVYEIAEISDLHMGFPSVIVFKIYPQTQKVEHKIPYLEGGWPTLLLPDAIWHK